MVAASVDSRSYPNRSLGRRECSGKLLWLRVRDAVTAQVLPGTGYLAKPVFHLRNDEPPELSFGKLLRAEDRDRHQVLPRRSVTRRDLGKDGEIIHGTSAITV